MVKTKTISPLAPEFFPEIAPVKGVDLAGIYCGYKKNPLKKDLLCISLAEDTIIAGVFTKSKCAAASILWCQSILQSHHKARVIIVNSGNANAFTGEKGWESLKKVVHTASHIFSCREDEIYMASTGVIGVPLPYQPIVDNLGDMAKTLSRDNWLDAAEAIMTTDTYAKGASRQFEINGHTYTISGIAKGSGMIAPDMATMLGFIFTDATISQPALQQALHKATNASFNSITVDGDTSTSDMVLLCATQKQPEIRNQDMPHFEQALQEVCQDLAWQIVKDGEGARKFVSIHVKGAISEASAKRIGMSIANSPLIKTAIAGEDANWGRIVMAVGKAGEPADPDKLSISMGGIAITENGQLLPYYNEALVSEHMRGINIDIEVNLNLGEGEATVWTCDLTTDYIYINGSYRT